MIEDIPRRTLVERIIEEFVDSWVLHAFLMPTNVDRDSYRIETIQKLEILIQILHELDFERISLSEWNALDSIEEEKLNN